MLRLELKRVTLGKKFVAEVDVTDNCNLRCKHCYHFKFKKDFLKKEVPLESWNERFNDLYKSGVRLILLIGGEPALRKDVIDLANKIFPYVSIISNGTIKIPKEYKNRIIISIDGNEKMNDSIRGKGVFSKVLKNYSDDQRVIINITLMDENYKQLEDIVKLSRKHGFRGVVCNIYTPGIDFRGSMFLEKKRREKIIDELKRVKSVYPDDFLLSKDMIKWYEFPDHKNYCYWGDHVHHFDVTWKKRRCFAKADCSNCGCFGGTMQSPLKMLFSPRIAYKILSV